MLNYYYFRNNHCYTLIVVHNTGPRAIPQSQRRGSGSITGPGASESRGPDSETLHFLKMVFWEF